MRGRSGVIECTVDYLVADDKNRSVSKTLASAPSAYRTTTNLVAVSARGLRAREELVALARVLTVVGVGGVATFLVPDTAREVLARVATAIRSEAAGQGSCVRLEGGYLRCELRPPCHGAEPAGERGSL